MVARPYKYIFTRIKVAEVDSVSDSLSSFSRSIFFMMLLTDCVAIADDVIEQERGGVHIMILLYCDCPVQCHETKIEQPSWEFQYSLYHR